MNITAPHISRVLVCLLALSWVACGDSGGGGIYKSDGGAQAGGQDLPLPVDPIEKPPILNHRAILADNMDLPTGWRYIGDSVNKDEFLSAQFAYRDETGARHYFDVTLELMSEIAGAKSHMKVKRAGLRSPSGDLSNPIPELGDGGFFDIREPTTVHFSRHNAFITVRREGSGTGSANLAKIIDERILGLLRGEIIPMTSGGTTVTEIPASAPPPGYVIY